jgi:hypothetical protein
MDAAKGGGASSASSASRRSEAGATRQPAGPSHTPKDSGTKAGIASSDRASLSQEVHQKAEASSVVGGLADWFGGCKETKPESGPDSTPKGGTLDKAEIERSAEIAERWREADQEAAEARGRMLRGNMKAAQDLL